MHVLGFTLFILGFVMAHPIMNPTSIYNTVEQYKLDCYEYYKTKYEEQLKEEPVVEPISKVETVTRQQGFGLEIKIPNAILRMPGKIQNTQAAQ